jgi:hypothetical protein
VLSAASSTALPSCSPGWQSHWQSGCQHRPLRDRSRQTTHPIRRAAMLLDGTRQTGRASLLIRRSAVESTPESARMESGDLKREHRRFGHLEHEPRHGRSDGDSPGAVGGVAALTGTGVSAPVTLSVDGIRAYRRSSVALAGTSRRGALIARVRSAPIPAGRRRRSGPRHTVRRLRPAGVGDSASDRQPLIHARGGLDHRSALVVMLIRE